MQASACFAIELAISPPSLPAGSWPQWHRHSHPEQSTGPQWHRHSHPEQFVLTKLSV